MDLIFLLKRGFFKYSNVHSTLHNLISTKPFQCHIITTVIDSDFLFPWEESWLCVCLDWTRSLPARDFFHAARTALKGFAYTVTHGGEYDIDQYKRIPIDFAPRSRHYSKIVRNDCSNKINRLESIHVRNGEMPRWNSFCVLIWTSACDHWDHKASVRFFSISSIGTFVYDTYSKSKSRAIENQMKTPLSVYR